MLFTGHSGKNKLLAAQLFAHELSVDLYQIDLHRIVSKYVGDTEKNLDALFKAAEASDAVLLFDDTDHLFGSAAVEDSGRFPNLNVAQLRQRIESYDGVVVSAPTTARTSIRRSPGNATKSSSSPTTSGAGRGIGKRRVPTSQLSALARMPLPGTVPVPRV